MTSRYLSNGRSPLVRKESQITAFFSTSTRCAPTPKPTAEPSPSPSPLNSKARKPPLTVTSPPKSSPPKWRNEDNKKQDAGTVPPGVAVGKRLRVYWLLDKAWHQGRVDTYDEGSRRHRVKHNEGEKEEVDLVEEKFEWAADEVAAPPARKLRRLRRLADTAQAKTPSVAEDE